VGSSNISASNLTASGIVTTSQVSIPDVGGKLSITNSAGTELASFNDGELASNLTLEGNLDVKGDAVTVQGSLSAANLLTHTTGSYCIIAGSAAGPCPTGFILGNIRFDTEDTDNGDGFSGTTGGIVNGSNSSVNIYVCCK